MERTGGVAAIRHRLPDGRAAFGYQVARSASAAPTPAPELALLLSTSGSTGSPKLIRLSWTNIAAAAHESQSAIRRQAIPTRRHHSADAVCIWAERAKQPSRGRCVSRSDRTCGFRQAFLAACCKDRVHQHWQAYPGQFQSPEKDISFDPHTNIRCSRYFSLLRRMDRSRHITGLVTWPCTRKSPCACQPGFFPCAARPRQASGADVRSSSRNITASKARFSWDYRCRAPVCLPREWRRLVH